MGGQGGGLGGLLAGLGGGGLGGLLGGGLNELDGRMRQNGRGQAMDSWVSTGANHQMEPHDLEAALGPDVLEDLEENTGPVAERDPGAAVARTAPCGGPVHARRAPAGPQQLLLTGHWPGRLMRPGPEGA